MLACANDTFPSTAVPSLIFDGSPTRSQAERTGRRDRRPTKFYELRDNLPSICAEPFAKSPFGGVPAEARWIRMGVPASPLILPATAGPSAATRRAFSMHGG